MAKKVIVFIIVRILNDTRERALVQSLLCDCDNPLMDGEVRSVQKSDHETPDIGQAATAPAQSASAAQFNRQGDRYGKSRILADAQDG